MSRDVLIADALIAGPKPPHYHRDTGLVKALVAQVDSANAEATHGNLIVWHLFCRTTRQNRLSLTFRAPLGERLPKPQRVLSRYLAKDIPQEKDCLQKLN